MIDKFDYKEIKTSLLYNLKIKLMTEGEVKNSKTLNYRSLAAEEDGLFCSNTFGSYKNNKCLCGNTVVEDDFSMICRFCGIEVSNSKIRRKKSAYVNLNGYFLNTLFLTSTSSILSLILGITVTDIENILYNNYYLVIYSNTKFLKINQVLSSFKYFDKYDKYYDLFYAETGFLGIKKALDYVNYSEVIFKLKKFFFKNKNIDSIVYKKKLKKYILFRKFKSKDIIISHIFFKKLFILPPDLRPIVKLSEGNLAASDLNELYKRIIDKNIRLKKLIELKSPNIILNNEKRILQESIDNLFDNKEKPKDTIYGKKSKVLKSLSSNIKGKKGLFRQNLLGKRVDFSARSVIVSGPHLKLNECAIPKIIALELYRPFIYGKLIFYKLKSNIKEAKLEVDKKTKLVYYILNEILKNNLILLNRAPTLHRLGMQAFKVLLTNDKTIKLHPLVCTAFNADFDGDQMAAHIPISSKSVVEFKRILISTKNILHPANGDFCIAPTQDIVLGIYYATKIIYEKNFMIFDNLQELRMAYNKNLIKLNTRIFYRIIESNTKTVFNQNIYETTMGRVMIFDILPRLLPFSCINKNLKKKDITNILEIINDKVSLKSVIDFSDNLMRLGFYFATLSGISICTDDMIGFLEKKEIVNDFKKLIKIYNADYLNGLVGNFNKKRKIINLWQLCCDIISYKVIKTLFLENKNSDDINQYHQTNSLAMIMDSGARGSEIQLKQICAMRGLVFYKKQGIMETPIISSLKEGLSVLEYFFSAHNSRKTLADTALKTSSAGYLTRRLVEIASDIIINKEDCKTDKGLVFKTLINDGNIVDSLLNRILGRINLENLYDKNGLIIFKKNTLIDKNNINIIRDNKIDIIKIRSPITCKLKKGICILCYGIDLSKRKLVNLGEAVGIIAAQAIGEPGTQLTMRTFHSAGAFSATEAKPYYLANNDGYIEYSGSLKYILLDNNSKLVISKIGKIFIKNLFGDVLEEIRVPYVSKILVDNKSKVLIKDLICEWDVNYNFTISDINGYVKLENFFENFNFIKRINYKTGGFDYEILQFQNNIIFKKPIIRIFLANTYLCSKTDFFIYDLSPGDTIVVSDNDYVSTGDVIIKKSTTLNKLTDIVGGLPKVIELFEASIPKNHAVIAPENSTATIRITKSGRKYLILDLLFKKFKKIIPPDRQILIHSGQKVEKGDILVNGPINPHDILEIYGENALVDFYLSEVKYIYYLQGVKINDKHIEIIIKQMLKDIMILSSINKRNVPGEIVKKTKILSINKKKIKSKDYFIYKNILSGITKASLNSSSFLSAASFQRTNQVLSEAAIIEKTSKLTPIKDKSMLGNIIPVGSGFYERIYKKIFINFNNINADN